MFDKMPNAQQVGTIQVYDTESGSKLLNTIPISKFSRCDGVITCGYNLNGDAVVISGFPTVVTYNPAKNEAASRC